MQIEPPLTKDWRERPGLHFMEVYRARGWGRLGLHADRLNY